MPDYEYAQPSQDLIAKLRDMEEKIRLLKDRVLLIGQTHIEEREKTFSDLQELKKALLKLNNETVRIQEILQNITEQLDRTAMSEDVEILKRQFALFRKT